MYPDGVTAAECRQVTRSRTATPPAVSDRPARYRLDYGRRETRHGDVH
jgi:hypothetical protein